MKFKANISIPIQAEKFRHVILESDFEEGTVEFYKDIRSKVLYEEYEIFDEELNYLEEEHDEANIKSISKID